MKSRLITFVIAILIGTLPVAFTTLVCGFKSNNSPARKSNLKEWMPGNLKVSKFANGEPIMEAKTTEEWHNAGKNKQPAWCYYNNDPKNDRKYGKLYNWYAVNDPRGLAPEGWHVPDDKEWNNFPGNNVAGGIRAYGGVFSKIDSVGFWWSATPAYSADAWCRYLVPSLNYVRRLSHDKYYGLSVRCIKD